MIRPSYGRLSDFISRVWILLSSGQMAITALSTWSRLAVFQPHLGRRGARFLKENLATTWRPVFQGRIQPDWRRGLHLLPAILHIHVTVLRLPFLTVVAHIPCYRLGRSHYQPLLTSIKSPILNCQISPLAILTNWKESLSRHGYPARLLPTSEIIVRVCTRVTIPRDRFLLTHWAFNACSNFRQ